MNLRDRIISLLTKKPEPPRARMLGPSVAKVGERVTFDGRYSTGDYINWRFGLDGEHAITAWGPGQPTVTYSYDRPGTFYVSFILIGPTGLVTEATHSIIVS